LTFLSFSFVKKLKKPYVLKPISTAPALVRSHEIPQYVFITVFCDGILSSGIYSDTAHPHFSRAPKLVWVTGGNWCYQTLGVSTSLRLLHNIIRVT